MERIASARSRPVEILLVEDNPADIRLTIEGLKEAKIRNNLQTAMSGEQALDVLYRRGDHATAPRPDVIFLDLNMPGMNGLEVLRRVKSDGALKTIPVVMLTSSEAESDIISSYEEHANCYVSKPVAFEAFTKVVRSIESFWFEVVKLP